MATYKFYLVKKDIIVTMSSNDKSEVSFSARKAYHKPDEAAEITRSQYATYLKMLPYSKQKVALVNKFKVLTQ